MKHHLVRNDEGELVWEEKPRVVSTSQATLPSCPSTYTEARPLVSQGMACHPRQTKDFNKSLEERGLLGSAHYDRDGNFVTTSRHARNEELKFRGLRDADAGYGDHAGYN